MISFETWQTKYRRRASCQAIVFLRSWSDYPPIVLSLEQTENSHCVEAGFSLTKSSILAEFEVAFRVRIYSDYCLLEHSYFTGRVDYLLRVMIAVD